ncbi:hypothetical protein VNO77_26967 [Canavalia gladiata]|uniref:Uncharacterized protein n=1 Tax=Canavalia gladiata TaxID=3824 RepID=A0AAN9Q623_CANGL
MAGILTLEVGIRGFWWVSTYAPGWLSWFILPYPVYTCRHHAGCVCNVMRRTASTWSSSYSLYFYLFSAIRFTVDWVEPGAALFQLPMLS